jgi:hypothetical protein
MDRSWLREVRKEKPDFFFGSELVRASFSEQRGNSARPRAPEDGRCLALSDRSRATPASLAISAGLERKEYYFHWNEITAHGIQAEKERNWDRYGLVMHWCMYVAN